MTFFLPKTDFSIFKKRYRNRFEGTVLNTFFWNVFRYCADPLIRKQKVGGFTDDMLDYSRFGPTNAKARYREYLNSIDLSVDTSDRVYPELWTAKCRNEGSPDAESGQTSPRRFNEIQNFLNRAICSRRFNVRDISPSFGVHFIFRLHDDANVVELLKAIFPLEK